MKEHQDVLVLLEGPHLSLEESNDTFTDFRVLDSLKKVDLKLLKSSLSPFFQIVHYLREENVRDISTFQTIQKSLNCVNEAFGKVVILPIVSNPFVLHDLVHDGSLYSFKIDY